MGVNLCHEGGDVVGSDEILLLVAAIARVGPLLDRVYVRLALNGELHLGQQYLGDALGVILGGDRYLVQPVGPVLVGTGCNLKSEGGSHVSEPLARLPRARHSVAVHFQLLL